MNGAITHVNILIHGLFFMTYDPSSQNLVILAPNITGHHFVGGVRGNRAQLSGDVNLTSAGLQPGFPDFPGDPLTTVPRDVKGSIPQFTRDETGLGDFSTDSSRFVGRIILPWPGRFHSLRCDDLATTFDYDPHSFVGARIEARSRAKGSSMIGVVLCLRYKVANPNQVPWPANLNPHYYLQPCLPHDADGVNDDLYQASFCFTNHDKFDFRMLKPKTPIPRTDPGLNKCNDNPPGLDPNGADENSLDEENAAHAPDVMSICAQDKADTANGGPGEPAVSPANCPIFYVG